MARFGTIPPEPPTITSLGGCAPALQRAVPLVLAAMASRGLPSKIRETLRTNERQAWLQGFGRRYDDDRGIVTNVPTKDMELSAELAAVAAEHGWHFYGTAVDIVHATLEDGAPASYWDALAEEYERAGMTAGRRWTHMRGGEGDKPHGQCGPPMLANPSDHAPELFALGGREEVWRVVQAL